MRFVGGVMVIAVVACSASTRELPADMFAMPANSAPILLAGVDASVVVDAGPRSALASARKKKDAVEDLATICPAHARQTGPTDFTVPQTMWTALRNEVSRSDSFSPHLDANNAVDGYTITNVGPCFAEIGLVDYDLLRSINEIDVSDTSHIWESIQQTNTALVRIERAGIPVELHYKVQL